MAEGGRAASVSQILSLVMFFIDACQDNIICRLMCSNCFVRLFMNSHSVCRLNQALSIAIVAGCSLRGSGPYGIQ